MSQAPHSHGLAGELVEPDWPLLAEVELHGLLAHYPALGALHSVTWHSPRPFSTAALVRTSAGDWFVKRHHRKVRSVPWLEEEHRFVAHLRRGGVPAPKVQASASGATAIEQGGWSYEVHARAEGADLYRDAQSWEPFQCQTHARAAGRALAQLHGAAEGYTAPARQASVLVSRPQLLADANLLGALAHHLHRQPALAHYLAGRDWQDELARLILPAQAALLPHLPGQPALWTHNDWHASNLLWNADPHQPSVATVLDFGLCDRTFALYDLATALERNAIPWLELDHGGGARADLATVDDLLAGYASLRPLPPAAIDALCALLPLVHLDFAVAEVAYFQGILNNRASADIAWDGYLLRHARWFAEVEGQRLIEHLQQRRGDWA
ncbi:phosphotransferase [Pseudomonas sp. RIT-PI-S]|uniref:phosphotransferase enzyme family protein n=1 Tax=Pseudomonas sp. RIT-PI-S TaxID=3035295 RepID=UPI0021DB3880|nr:phosphotransferase [Pseudomonas sp. RIT-PI-S]